MGLLFFFILFMSVLTNVLDLSKLNLDPVPDVGSGSRGGGGGGFGVEWPEYNPLQRKVGVGARGCHFR